MRPSRLLPLLVLVLLCVSPGVASADASVTSNQQDVTRLDFGNVIAGTSRSATVTVTNDGFLPVTLGTFYTSGGDASLFRAGPGSCQTGIKLAPVQSCSLQATFSPRELGIVSTSLYVTATDLRGNASSSGFLLKGRGSRIPGDCSDAQFPAQRDPGNPLALSPADHPAGTRNPLQGMKMFVDRTEGLAVPYLRAHPSLHKIADQPENKRFSRFTGNGSPRDAQKSVRQFLCRQRLQQPGSVPTGSVYRIHHDRCGNVSDSRREQRAYRQWMDGFAKGVGRSPIVLFYEFDSLITVGCLSHTGLNARIGELRYGIKKLSQLPHTVIYLDAGASDALTAGRAAHLLNAVGLGSIQGFFLNSTHYSWTSTEVAYGRRISRATHGKHFVVSTAVNGRGPLRPRSRVRSGNEVLCNPAGRGLGPRPTTTTTSSAADAFLWIGNPGRSGGKCHNGDATNGRFFLKYALGLISRADEQLGPHAVSSRY